MNRTLISTYSRLQKYLNNSLWILGEKVVGLGASFIAMIFVSRYLGAENFGSLAYATSLTQLLSAAGHMGLSGLLVREIVKAPKTRADTLGTAATLKFVGMALGYLVLLVYAFVYEGLGTIKFYLVIITGTALFLKPLDVVDFWFQAHVQARYTAVARTSSHLVTAVFKLVLVYSGSTLIYFATAQVLQALVAGLLLLLFFRLKAELRLVEWRFSWVRARELLSQGWLIYLGSAFAVVNLKVDQIMLRWLANVQEVGQYAVAAQLSQIWYILPTAIVASVFPKLIKLHERDNAQFYCRLQQIFDALFLLSLVVAVTVTFGSSSLIVVLFGDQYAGSASMLAIHIWAGIFIFMRAGFSKWILIENAYYFSLFTQGFGAFTNVLLNYFFIPASGGVGAAYATLISYSVSSFFALVFYKRTRPVFKQMAWAMLSPARYSFRFARMRG